MASSRPETARDLRKAFTEFFQERGHTQVPSSGIVPTDPSLLFTVAGMVPFKQYFLGMEQSPYKRAVSIQKCLRAGGKHNDLEEIGYTSRHLSFFEMMGNFSFGDYFKKDAIIWAWEFSTQVLRFNPKDIWVTVHVSDDEAEKLWLDNTDVIPEQVQRLDEPNYWKMADTGPCGPCSELFFDKGKEYGDDGGPSKGGQDRFIEFWNLVFMQYEQKADGSQVELAKPSIDTGAGLERLLALIQGVETVFDVGDLSEMMKTAKTLVGKKKSDALDTREADKQEEVSVRIVVEHARAAAFTISDGVVPSNEDRGYVLRRIIRRAIRHAHLLGIYEKNESAILPLVEQLTELVKDDYPQIFASREKILQVLKNEESRFLQTLETGGHLLEKSLKEQKDKTLSGEIIFTLHDTYGFPYDLTDEIAKEVGFELDKEGFESEMKKQKERARADRKSKSDRGSGIGIEVEYEEELTGLRPTDFLGNQEYEVEAEVLAVTKKGIVLDKTSFYAESGGQVGDIGKIGNGDKVVDIFDTVYGASGVVLHRTEMQPPFKVGDKVLASIDGERRDYTRRHHTATHILHWALREILGEHVGPQGSLVEPKRLRFDFSHWQALSQEEIVQVEDMCNEEILSNQPVRHFETTRTEADSLGAVAFFEEKYGEIVKVLEAGKNSIELCGGTHVSALGDIGPLKIISESSIGSNIRRVEAVCGALPVELLRQREKEASEVADLLGVPVADLVVGAKRKAEEIKQLRQDLGNIKSESAMSQLDGLAKNVEGQILATKIEGVDRDTLRKMAVALRDENKIDIVIVGAEIEAGGAALIAAVNTEAVSVKAGELLEEAAKLILGGGGKGQDLAVAGGKDASGLDKAIEMAKEIAQKSI